MFDILEPQAILRHLCDMFPLGVTREQVQAKLSARDFAFLDALLVTPSSHEHESVLGYFLRTWKSALTRSGMAPNAPTSHAPGDGPERQD